MKRKKNKKPKLVLGLILIFALFLSLGITYGPSTTEGADDFIYTDAGYLIANNRFKELSGILANRYILGAGNAFFYLLLGYSPFSASLFGVVCFLATIVVVYEIAKILFSEDVGLIAAFLFSILPGAVFQSSNVGNSIPMTFFASLSVLFAFKAIEKRTVKYLLLSGYISVVGFLTSGEEILIIPVLFFIVVFYSKKLKNEFIKGVLSLVFGILLGVATLCLLSYLHSSDLFEWYNVNANFYTEIGHDALKPKLNSYLRVLFPGWLVFPDFADNYYGLYGYLMIFFLFVAFLKKEKKVIVLLFWFIFILFYLSFGTVSLRRYVIHPFAAKYLLILAPAMVTIIAFGIYETAKNLKKESKIGLLLFVILMLAFVIHSVFLSIYLLYSKISANYLLTETGKVLLRINTHNSKVYFRWALPIQIFIGYKFESQGFAGTVEECKSFKKGSFIVTFKNQTLQNACNLTEITEVYLPENLKNFEIFGFKIPTAEGDVFWGIGYKSKIVAIYKN